MIPDLCHVFLGGRAAAEYTILTHWAGKPAGVMGASVGTIGTAIAQQHLRNVLAYLDVPTLGQPEVFIQVKDGFFDNAGNIANADTPGFKTKDIDFQFEFMSLMEGGSPNVIEAPGLAAKNDGNNVNMERESRLLAENGSSSKIYRRSMGGRAPIMKSSSKRSKPAA
jgi:hypothetical protein